MFFLCIFFFLKTYSSIEIRRKTVYQITLNNQLELSGIEITTELYREYSLQVIVSDVKIESESEKLGINEILKLKFNLFYFSRSKKR